MAPSSMSTASVTGSSRPSYASASAFGAMTCGATSSLGRSGAEESSCRLRDSHPGFAAYLAASIRTASNAAFTDLTDHCISAALNNVSGTPIATHIPIADKGLEHGQGHWTCRDG